MGPSNIQQNFGAPRPNQQGHGNQVQGQVPQQTFGKGERPASQLRPQSGPFIANEAFQQQSNNNNVLPPNMGNQNQLPFMQQGKHKVMNQPGMNLKGTN